MPSTKPTPKEAVLQMYPEAFAEDDGDSVYIMTRKIVTEKCPTCQQQRTQKVTDYRIGALGSGGTESYAWESAARSIRAVLYASEQTFSEQDV